MSNGKKASSTSEPNKYPDRLREAAEALCPEVKATLAKLRDQLGSGTWFNDDIRRDWLLVFECQDCVRAGERWPQIGLAASALSHYDKTRNRSDELLCCASSLRCGRHGPNGHLKLVKRVIVHRGGREEQIQEFDWQQHGPGAPGRFGVNLG